MYASSLVLIVPDARSHMLVTLTGSAYEYTVGVKYDTEVSMQIADVSGISSVAACANKCAASPDCDFAHLDGVGTTCRLMSGSIQSSTSDIDFTSIKLVRALFHVAVSCGNVRAH